MPNVVKRTVDDVVDNVTNNARDLNDNLNNATGGAYGQIMPLNPLRLSDNINDVYRFGRDVTGVTARDAANAAADEQAQAQMDAEAAARHQKRLEENSADFRRQRNAQQVKQMVAGGRTGTLMNGTTGFTTGSGDTTGGPTGGSKTLMGK